MKRKIVAALLLIVSGVLLLSYSCLQAQSRDITIGQTITLKSSVLNEDRNIMISLPAGYTLTTTDKYPVIYILDAETHFNLTVTTVQFLSAMGMMPQAIVVGVPNVNRNRDYTPTQVANLPASGGADKFLKFMAEELQPYIDKNYRTYPYRILAGHSLCGMMTFYTMFTRPELFNSFVGISPWVIYDNEYIIGLVKSKLEEKKPINKVIYFTAGSKEINLLPKMNDFLEILKAKAPKDLDWKYKLMEGDDHGSLLLSTVEDGLRYIYKDWAMPDRVAESGVDAVVKHYEGLSSKFGYKVDIPEFTLNNAGYQLLMRQRIDDAIAMFKKNVELHPNSANVYDSLGEAFERSGQMKLAKDSYEKAYNIGKKENHAFTETFKTNMERAAKASTN